MLSAMNDNVPLDSVLRRRLVELVARGNAVIAALLRLHGNVPSSLLLDKKDDRRLAAVLHDFSYFKNPDAVEQKIKKDKTLRALDDEWRSRYGRLVESSYATFEDVYRYAADMNHLARDLADGLYFQHTLAGLLASSLDARQLLCEMLYLYGVMLLVVERLDGATRERLLVLYCRLGHVSSHHPPSSPSSPHCHVDDVCRLVADTGASISAGRRPAAYPTSYFSRVPIDSELVSLVLAHLRTGDIYCQTANFQLPEHRSVALASQAAMLFVCLFFEPDTLHNDAAFMREIVDRFFPDTWVVHVYMGWCVDVFEWWNGFRCARAVLHTCLDTTLVKRLTDSHASSLQPLLNRVQTLLLCKQRVHACSLLQDWQQVASLVRQCNSTLRWCMLAVSSGGQVRRSRLLRDIVCAESRVGYEQLFELLLLTARLEHSCRSQLKQMLAQREDMWQKTKRELVEGLRQLADVFHGGQVLTKLAKNERVERWFLARADDMDAVTLAAASGGLSCKLVQMISALEQVHSLHGMSSDAAVTQLIELLCDRLRRLVLLSTRLNQRVLAQLDVLADFGYGWQLVDGCCRLNQLIQTAVLSSPQLLAHMDTVFVKLSSALHTPLLRMSECESVVDMSSVSRFFSDQLLDYVHRLLQAVPASIFSLLDELGKVSSGHVTPVPCQNTPGDMTGQCTASHDRIGAVLQRVSVLSEGVLLMSSSLLGVVRLDPAQLLARGVARQLRRQLRTVLTAAFGRDLHPPSLTAATAAGYKGAGSSLYARLHRAGGELASLRRSVELGQHCLHIDGARQWHYQLCRVVSECARPEVERYRCLLSCDTISEGDSVSVSVSASVSVSGVDCDQFMSRIVQLLIAAIHPRESVYVGELLSWHLSRQPSAVSLDRRLVELLVCCVGVSGLMAVDTILALHTQLLLKKSLRWLIEQVDEEQAPPSLLHSVRSLHATLTSHDTTADTPPLYKTLSAAAVRLQRPLCGLVDYLSQAGALCRLRQLIRVHVRVGAELDSRHLTATLDQLDRSLLACVQNADAAPTQQMAPVLRRAAAGVDWTGGGAPASCSVYVGRRQLQQLIMPAADLQLVPQLLLMLLEHCHTSGRMAFSHKLGCLSAMRDGTDTTALLCGLHVLLHQLPGDCSRQLLAAVRRLISDMLLAGAGDCQPLGISTWLAVEQKLRDYQCHLVADSESAFVPAVVAAAYMC